MRRLLHIRIRAEDPLAAQLLAQQRQLPDLQIDCFDLTQPDPDYLQLLEHIFAADTIQID